MQHLNRFGGSVFAWQICAERMALAVLSAYLVILPGIRHPDIGLGKKRSTFCP